MKLRILSDLHLEFGDYSVPKVEANAVILAGDIHVKWRAIDWIRREFPEQPVLYVLGNHEYYGEKIPRLVEKLRHRCAGTNIRILENEAVELGGFRFFGATLWSDLSLFGDPHAGGLAALEMNDFKRIRVYSTWKRLKPADVRRFHAESVSRLTGFLARDARRSVIITHHAPSVKSLPEPKRSDRVSCAYASNLEYLIASTQPLLWIHGHIHRAPPAYAIGSTTVVANPRGYPDEPNTGFRPDFIFHLSDVGEKSS